MSYIPEKMIELKKQTVNRGHGVSNAMIRFFVSIFNALDNYFNRFTDKELNKNEIWIELA